jgi:iron complex outermembrane receptor protein
MPAKGWLIGISCLIELFNFFSYFKMKTGSFILFLLLQAIISSAQYRLAGIVKDENGGLLTNANVVLENTFMMTTTNAEGKFVFKNLRDENYLIKISYLGYETFRKKINVKDSGELDIRLNRSPVLVEEVLVSASRAGSNSSIAHSTIGKETLSNENQGQDIPYLLSMTPSFVTTSDAGTGIGYTNFRIRGTDLNRINVTMNGIPVSDAESHSTYFVDIPDIASSVENIQVQRGVGNSTNGAGAFGGSIDIQTSKLDSQAIASYSGSYGSFNTFKNNVSAGTGLNKNFAFNASLSKISSDGFIDRGASDLKSIFISGGYFTANTILKAVVFSGIEKTYQAWNGVPSVRLNNDLAGMQEYEDNYLYSHKQTQEMINSNSRTYNLYTYPNQVDNYQQDYYQLHFSHRFNPFLNLNISGFYTYGRGYYEQYEEDQNYEDYQLNAPTVNGAPVESTDLIRRKWLSNDFYGFIFSSSYKKNRSDLTIGGGGNIYDGKHFGRVIWSENGGIPDNDYEWYRGTGVKKDGNFYVRYNYKLSNKLSASADLQYRHIDYEIDGIDDNLRDLTQSHKFDFFNPKAGLFYSINSNNSMYVNYGRANREPNRDNFVDAPANRQPTFETLNDFEGGYQFKSPNFSFGANLYYMLYKNQLVLTGQINDVGSAIMTNADKSYRTGVELMAGMRFLKIFNWDVNATFSRNRIRDFTEYVENWDTDDLDQNKLGETELSFSPGIISNSKLSCKLSDNLDINLLSSYVSSQFIDNTSNNNRKLDAYFVNNVRFDYLLKQKLFNEVKLHLLVNNIFDEKYENNAWVYSYVYNQHRYKMDGYFPQAGVNFLFSLNIRF